MDETIKRNASVIALHISSVSLRLPLIARHVIRAGLILLPHKDYMAFKRYGK
ncbi:MAG: hypothetical protein BWY11_00768 [Firmicutes bacterium ADurb.Bin182]|nr:MAG: hypothetical protein BWY11_00768 [Firmicutes bacterium ADurb.Bin182]